MTITRRDFVKAGAAAPFLLSSPSWARARGANEEIRVAVVGLRGRGGNHINGFRKLKGVRVVAVCDVDQRFLDRAKAQFARRNESVVTYTDPRKLMEDRGVDVVSIATPNHWHALMAVWACEAGKDVYVEKPVSHNVTEGRVIVNATRKHDRIVQTGTQSRSSSGLREAMAWLHAGKLGRVLSARGLCYKRRGSIGKVKAPKKPPKSCDYDLWLGPAPKVPLTRRNLHYDWHWVWDTGNGDMGNQGVHQMDIARWALGEKTLAPKVWSVGSRLGYDDDGETPNTQVVVHAYEKAPLYFEVRGLPSGAEPERMDRLRGVSIGVIVDCEHGSMVIPSYAQADVYDNVGTFIRSFKGGGDHYANFIAAVRSRKAADLNAEILDGHLSSALCHTGNISLRLGKETSWKALEIPDGLPITVPESLSRLSAHLKRNGISTEGTRLFSGLPLEMAPEKEHFLNHAGANAMLTREYRSPYVFPDSL